MSVNRDLNLGTVVTVALFLVVQTGGAVWWASQMSAKLTSIGEDVSAQAEEDLRQWTRINGNEDSIAQVIALEAAIEAQLTAFENSIDDLRIDLRSNNNLLRELLRGRGPE
ncbi:MAG: hypothetical protein QNJ16_20680 [Rhodobacter sp.]|nr:hypothetical protein [Rhodobacter sp.]